MKKSITSILALIAVCAAPAIAVPSGINYQGALTDDQGNPITGTRMMSIKLYTAATDGTLLYSEDIGEVDVSDGVFSFEFGAGGTSNAQQTDTVAITDGTATSFQKVLSAAEVIAGSVSVTDGTYTWSQSGGSSNEDDFGVAYSSSLRRVTVTYYNGAPAAGRTITATYRTPASGISGALAGDNQPWAEITVDGVAQVPRQKVLTVPFAQVANSSLSVVPRGISATLPLNRFTSTYTSAGAGGASYSTNYIIPLDVAKISNLVFTYSLSATSHHGSGGGVAFSFEVVQVTPASGASTVVYSHRDSIMNPAISTFSKTIATGPIELPKTSNYYRIDVGIINTGSAHVWPATSANTGTFFGVTADYIKE